MSRADGQPIEPIGQSPLPATTHNTPPAVYSLCGAPCIACDRPQEAQQPASRSISRDIASCCASVQDAPPGVAPRRSPWPWAAVQARLGWAPGICTARARSSAANKTTKPATVPSRTQAARFVSPYRRVQEHDADRVGSSVRADVHSRPQSIVVRTATQRKRACSNFGEGQACPGLGRQKRLGRWRAAAPYIGTHPRSCELGAARADVERVCRAESCWLATVVYSDAVIESDKVV